MEIRHLRYFVAVAEALSFTKAAVMLHLAQPSLTHQIKELEEELGVVLLNRTKHQVSLTNEGHPFLIDANRLLNLAREMVNRSTIDARRGLSAQCRLRNQSFLRLVAANACFV